MTAIDRADILIMATDGFEQSELEVPLHELRKRGATVRVAAPAKTREPGKICGWKNGNWGTTVPVDLQLGEARVEDFDAIVIPGGQMNPDKLRLEPEAVNLVRAFCDAGKVVAAICHGPWLLVEAGVVEGRDVTSFASIRTDMENAGGIWHDEEVVTDDGIITSRSPADLPAFVDKICEELAEGRHPRGEQVVTRVAGKGDLM